MEAHLRLHVDIQTEGAVETSVLSRALTEVMLFGRVISLRFNDLYGDIDYFTLDRLMLLT